MTVPDGPVTGSGPGGYVTGSSGLNAPGAAFHGDINITVDAAQNRFRPNVTEYNDRHLLTFLQKELRSGSHVRLLDPVLGREQRGLADIFVDLDARLVPEPQLIRGSRYPAVGQDNEGFKFLERQLSADRVSRMVLTGGPGQGKTTAVQMLAQIHRCAMLRRFDSEMLSPNTTAELERVDRLLDGLNLALPSCTRLPLWVEAEALASHIGRAPHAQRSMWHFLAERHERVLNTPVTAGTIRELAEGRPTLVLLDGYDEVPSGYRHMVMEHIMDFADEMQLVRADAAIIVTSRPQAYQNELRSHRFVGWSLDQLNPETAERHAAVIAGPGDEGRHLLQLFREALSSSSVLDLLNTPLHVALLVALLAESGSPPAGRHRLFSRYYDHVYLREKGRGGELGTFLAKYRDLVDELHRRAAFRILAAAEGRSDPRGIAPDEFATIARSLVREVGVADSQGEEEDIVLQLIRFARERLVLIVGIDSDEVGFQIKSFAEFLAAAHLARTSDETLVRDRLRAIAASEPWRNVARFMAAAAFETDIPAKRDLRDTVVTVLAELDRKEFAGPDALLLRGAELAVDLLSDVPDMDEQYRRHLIPSTRVIENLSHRIGPLAVVAAPDFDEQRIADLIGVLYATRSGRWEKDVLWRFLNKLAEHGNTAAAEAAREYAYSASPAVLPRLLCEIAIPKVVKPEELPDLLCRADPNKVHGSSLPRDVGLLTGWTASAWEVLHGGRADRELDVYLEGLWHLMGPNTLKGRLLSMARLSQPPAECHPHWSALAWVGRALKDPTPDVVDALTRALPDLRGGPLAKDGPWPLQEALAADSLSGALDVNAWYTAEDRWKEQGVGLHDVETYLAHGALGHRVATSGFPFGTVHWSLPGGHKPEISELALDVWRVWHKRAESHPTYRAHVASNVLLPMCDYGATYGINTLSPQQTRDIIYSIPADNDTYLVFPTVLHALSELPNDAEFADLAERLTLWRWSTGDGRAKALSAHEVVARASRIMAPGAFRTFCRNVAQQTTCLRTWETLMAYWIEPMDPSHTDWPLTNLLRVRDGLPSRRDIARAAAAEQSAWTLFRLIDSIPCWSEEVRKWVREQLLLQSGEPWMVYAPSIWPRARESGRPLPLSTLRVSIV
ncbi:NACHT domain-containing protein [Nonomuraea sp. NPDC049028]|uniref:NACHT domain-containing protein n=1 Tax=Nonomuraea sp. NPDC049028 TaxID=3364348 RepID=UPI00371D0F92